MGITKTVHPPAGATALLAATTAEISELGWFLIPLGMLGTAAVLVVALLVNNLQRQFPLWWWTEVEFSREEDGRDTGNRRGDERSGMVTRYIEYVPDRRDLIMAKTGIWVPDHVKLSAAEEVFLEALRSKLFP